MVHNTTVTSKRMTPSVPRARPPNVAELCTSRLSALSVVLQEEEETLGGRMDVGASHGTGIVKSAAAAGGHGGGSMPLIVLVLRLVAW